MMLGGSVRLGVAGGPEPVTVKTGETVLFPAELSVPTATSMSDATWIEVTFPG